MHLYNKDGTIKKYDTVYQIADEHYYVRLNMYVRRKAYELDNLQKEINLLEAKMRFIQDVIDDKIVIYKQSKGSINEKLCELEYPFFENGEIIEYDENIDVKTEYNYLLNLAIHNFTSEKVDELENDIKTRRERYDTLDLMDPKDIWRKELDELEEKYKELLK